MSQELICTWPLIWLFVHAFHHKILCIFIDFVSLHVVVYFTFFYLLVQRLFIRIVKWTFMSQKVKCGDSQRPDVTFFIIIASNHFRRHIFRSPVHSTKFFIHTDLSKTKINYFDKFLFHSRGLCKKNILRLDVSMNDSFCVTM